jgi:hypothetical protein
MAHPSGTYFGASPHKIATAPTTATTIDPGVQAVKFTSASACAVTIADAKEHTGFFWLKDASTTGTAAKSVTLTVGTFDGTNNKATANAANEMLLVWFDEDGAGTIILNTGSVALATA